MNDFKVGQSVSITRKFTESDVEAFAAISHDDNPLHLDADFAKDSIFKARVVHGALVNSLFSSLLGTKLPGEGTIYCKQDTTFLAPVYINDSITATVTIKRLEAKKDRIILTTQAFNHHGKMVIDGEAMILYKKKV